MQEQMGLPFGHEKDGVRWPADDDWRRERQNPEDLLSGIGLISASTFVDVGCGGGFFALPAARIVGKSGNVFGLDMDELALARLQQLADKENLKNVHLMRGDVESLVVCEHCADIVFYGMTLHWFQNPYKVLENAKKMLGPRGRLVNMDWKKESMAYGPDLERRYSQEFAINLIATAGFSIETVRDSGPYHYLIVARP